MRKRYRYSLYLRSGHTVITTELTQEQEDNLIRAVDYGHDEWIILPAEGNDQARVLASQIIGLLAWND